jgi:transcriptional regulator with XRE-family HTH domain
MSRQFDEYMADKFELYGEAHSLIEPGSFEELIKAIQVKDVIQTAISSLMHDEDSSGWDDLLQTQNDFIHEYLSSLGEFDNSFLVNNINYMAKKSDLRIGDLEKLLGISAGYISRTAKENSAKKLSVDVVWKIAKLFETDIKVLLETDLQIPNSNTEMAAKFLQKTYGQTADGTIEWINNGGVECELDERIKGTKLVTEDDAVTLYHPMRLSRDARFILVDDIFTCENINLEKEVLIIPFRLEKSDKINYDFILRWSEDDESNPDYGKNYFQRMFNTVDDPFGGLDVYANNLYQLIKNREYDTRISPEVKDIITDYLKSDTN